MNPSTFNKLEKGKTMQHFDTFFNHRKDTMMTSVSTLLFNRVKPVIPSSGQGAHPLALSGSSRFLLVSSASILVIGLLLWPEEAWGSNIEESLAKVQTTVNGPLLKLGMFSGTVIGTVTAAVKHSIGMALIVMGIGGLLSFYMTWLNTHNFAG